MAVYRSLVEFLARVAGTIDTRNSEWNLRACDTLSANESPTRLMIFPRTIFAPRDSTVERRWGRKTRGRKSSLRDLPAVIGERTGSLSLRGRRCKRHVKMRKQQLRIRKVGGFLDSLVRRPGQSLSSFIAGSATGKLPSLPRRMASLCVP